MQPVGQPAVDIEGHRRIVDMAYRRLVQGNSVLPKLLKERLAKTCRIDEQGALPRLIGSVHKHRHIDNILVHKNTGTASRCMEGQPTAADAFGLLPHEAGGLATHGDP
jgi:hypothetical protein